MSIAGSARGAIAIGESCDPAEALVCGSGTVRRLLAPGSYYVMSESRPATFGKGTLHVQTADLQGACEDAPLIRSGTTQLPMPANASYSGLTCASTTARWTLRKVVLQARARVVARIGLRRAHLGLWRGCAEEELLCRRDGSVERAIDQVLDPGTYYLVVDAQTREPVDLELEITRE